jgi:peptide-methionine (S)-S-oxide reductase
VKFAHSVSYAMCALSVLAILLADATEANKPAQAPSGTAVATFAGGCFWSMEYPFDKLSGVISTTSGYTGGRTQNPTYEKVSSGGTGHAEAVQVTFDPNIVSYETLLDVFWHNIDPLATNKQFCDEGTRYRTAIFYATPEQHALAEASKLKVHEEFDKPIATEIVAAGRFYPAEEYHQDYYAKNPTRYKSYRVKCGRDQRLLQLWGTPSGVKQQSVPL